jgi:hypothetical protein
VGYGPAKRRDWYYDTDPIEHNFPEQTLWIEHPHVGINVRQKW